MIKRYNHSGRYSMAIEHNGIFTTAGHVARNCKADITQQSIEALEVIEGLLDEAQISKAEILSATIWLSDINDYDAFNDVWDHWIDMENLPVRACVEAKLADPDLKVEIVVTAVRSN